MSIQKTGPATLVIGALLTAASSVPGLAEVPAAAAPQASAYDVVRVGDGQLSCTDLAGEINQLTRDVAADRASAVAQSERTARAAQTAADNASMARRVAMGGLVHASAFIPFGGGIAAMAVRSAAMNAAGTVAASPQMATPVIVAAAPVDTPKSQRLAALQGIFARKAC